MTRRILIDTNLLLLLLVGDYKRDFIEKHRRTNKYDEEDYDLLLMALDRAEIFTTQSVITEASNLLWYAGAPHDEAIRQRLIFFVNKAKEIPMLSADLIQHAQFMKLGLTDSGILEVAQKSISILTVDLDLHIAAGSLGLDSTNFNHFRYRA